METDETIPITVATEKTTYSELTDREKRIYNHAYIRGVEKGQQRYFFFYASIAMFIISCFILFKSWLP